MTKGQNKSRRQNAAARPNARPSANNIPTIICNPKRRYTIMMTDQTIETPTPAPFSGSVTYGQLYAALFKQISEHKVPQLTIPAPASFPAWRNIRLVSAAAWGVPFVGTAQTQGVKFSLVLVRDAQAQPSVEKFDQATGASDRPFGMVRGGPLNWSVFSESTRSVLTMTDVDCLTCIVEVW